MNDIPARLDTNNVTIYARSGSTRQAIPAESDSSVIQVITQSDWAEENPENLAYIKNKPATMPPSAHSHGSLTNAGALTNNVNVAAGDKLVVTDASDSSKIARSGIAFDGSTTDKALTPKGTWESFTPPTRTVNGHALSSDVTVTANDIGVEDGAEVNVLEGVKVNGSDLPISSKKVEIPKAGSSQFGVVKFAVNPDTTATITADGSGINMPRLDANGKISESVLPEGIGGDYVLTYEPLSSVGYAEIGEAITGTPNYTPAGDVVMTTADVAVPTSVELNYTYTTDAVVLSGVSMRTQTIHIPTGLAFIGSGVTFVIQEEEE